MTPVLTRRRTVFIRNPEIGWHQKFNIVVSVADGQQESGATEETINEMSSIFEKLVASGKLAAAKRSAEDGK